MREMKDSGVEWIGEIPRNWIRTGLLNVLQCKICDGPHETPEIIENGIPFISVDSLNDGKSVDLEIAKKHISQELYKEYYKKAPLEKGDILFSKAATIGKTAIVDDRKFMVWSPLAIIKVDRTKCSNTFIYYLLNCESLIKYISFLGGYNTQINVGMRDLEKAQIPIPPLKEQCVIADYLDAKCSQIDNIITKQKQIIEKLKEYRLSLVTEAVTKGIDSKVEMMNSGNQWIGVLPSGWTLCRMKHVFQNVKNAIKVGPFGSQLTTSDYVEAGKWVYNQRVVLDKNFIENDTFISDEKYHEMMGFAVEAGDVLITTRGTGTTGHIIKVPNDFRQGILHPCLMRIKLNEMKCLYEFLYYVFEWGSYVRKQIDFANNTSSLPVLYSYTLSNIFIALPNLTEQKKIVKHLDEKCLVINKTITQKENLIQRLNAYKKSLIYEVVTGKKEV